MTDVSGSTDVSGPTDDPADDPTARRLAGATLAGFVVFLLAAPLIALSWHATDSGAPDGAAPVVRAWEEPARDLLRPVLGLASPQAMYQALGLTFVVAGAGMVCGALLLGRLRRGAAARGERVCRRLVVGAQTVLLVGTLTVFLTGSDLAFLALMVPGMLLTLVGSTALGISLLRHRARPVATGVWLATAVPVFITLSTLAGHNAIGLLAVVAAWATLGWSTLRRRPGRSGAPPAGEVRAHRRGAATRART
jgi:hypothetical protein